MRINNAVRTERVATGSGARRTAAAGGGFSLDGTGQTQEAVAPRAAQPLAGVDALLALQGVGDATSERSRAVKRGHSMLDTLEELRLDLLAGALSPAKLDRLIGLVNARTPASGDPRIDQVIAEIDLRARVELAKRGHS